MKLPVFFISLFMVNLLARLLGFKYIIEIFLTKFLTIHPPGTFPHYEVFYKLVDKSINQCLVKNMQKLMIFFFLMGRIWYKCDFSNSQGLSNDQEAMM